MRLLQFRVKTFRSVEDSGWISCDEITTLIGMNEAGKSNLLLALWKLKPAKGGEINALADLPRYMLSEYRNKLEEITFIEADFEISIKDTKEIAAKSFIQNSSGLQVRVSKTLAGETSCEFLNAIPTKSINSPSFHKNLTEILGKIADVEASTTEIQTSKTNLVTDLQNAKAKAPTAETPLTEKILNEMASLALNSYSSIAEKSVFKSLSAQFWHEVDRIKTYFTAPHKISGVQELIFKVMPNFVYYANYGNLDAEIFLPQVIENLQRKDLTGVAEAKARTLRVLFEFVKLDPQEILDMGKESVNSTEEEIKAVSELKTERQALLHSAQRRLTKEFREWWKQGVLD